MQFINFLKHKMKALPRRQEGAASIEFLFVLPVLLILFYGAVEISRYVQSAQKLEKTANEIGNVVTQYNCSNGCGANQTANTLNDTVMSQLISAVPYMMSPYGTAATTRVIVTDIINTNAGTSNASPPTPTVQWQFCSTGGLANQSMLTSAGCGATAQGCVLTDAQFGQAGFPTNATGFEQNMASSEEVVVTEVYYKYTPITNQNNYVPFISTTPLYRMASYAPRQGTISGYVPGAAASKCP